MREKLELTMYGLTAPQPAEDADDGELETSELHREARRVLLWRYSQVRLLGVDPLSARIFAESEGDLEELRALVRRRGCPPQLALRIVL
jgi:hypothetical protein